eukprot:2481992-Prymnesium_polylepis.2
MMLSGEGYYECFRASQHAGLGTFYSYLYILATTIMMVNMLIALMSRTIEEVHENVSKHYLYSKTRLVSNWLVYPPIPPPFNLISVPYYTFTFVHEGLRLAWKRLCPSLVEELASLPRSDPTTRGRFNIRRTAKDRSSGESTCSEQHGAATAKVLKELRLRRMGHLPQDAELPKAWFDALGEDPLEYLADKIVTFKRDNAEAVSQNDDFKHSMHLNLTELRRGNERLRREVDKNARELHELKSIKKTNEELREELREMKTMQQQTQGALEK